MAFRSLRARCRKLVATLDIPAPFDLDEFCARISRQRERPIHLMPTTMPPGAPCGLWVGGRHADYVFYQSATSPLHQRHIVLHEIGHMLCDDGGPGSGADARLGGLLPDLDPALIRGILGRTSYRDDEERMAETIATLIQERITATRVVGTGLVQRIERSLESW